MPACIFNIIRRPNEGQSVNVFNAVIAAMEAHGRPGNVTTALTSPQPLGSGVNVISTIRFDSFDAAEEFHDSFLTNETATTRWDETASKCQSVDTNILESIRPVQDAPDGFVPKYMVRTIFTAKRGKRSELIDVLIENRESNPGIKGAIFKPIGYFQNVRLTQVFSSLDDVRASLAEIQSPENRERTDKIIQLTDRIIRPVSRIRYLKN